MTSKPLIPSATNGNTIEEIRDVFGAGAKWLLRLVFAIACASLLTVAWHYVMPPSWHWVLPDRLDTMSTVLFSGGLFVFWGLYIRDRI